MRKISTLLMGIVLGLLPLAGFAQVSIDATTAWFNNETFDDGYTAGDTYPTDGYSSEYDWKVVSASTPTIKIRTIDKPGGSNSGNVLGFSTNTANNIASGDNLGRGINIEKLFPNTLEGIVYVKVTAYCPERGVGIGFLNSSKEPVFAFGGTNATSNNIRAALTLPGQESWINWQNMLPLLTHSSVEKLQFLDWEFLMDLTSKKILAINTTHQGSTVMHGEIATALTNGGDIKYLSIVTGGTTSSSLGGTAIDNITIGNLLADNISNLTGDAELQTMSTSVNKTYSVKAFASVASLEIEDLELPEGYSSDITWSISSYGTLSAADQALVSIARNPNNHAEGILTTTDIISADATITIQAVCGETTLSLPVQLKAASVAGLKTTLLNEINTATALSGTIGAGINTYLDNAKTALGTVISTAQDLNSSDATAISTAIADLQTAQTDFTAALVPYNNFVATIAPAQDAHDAEVRTAPFFITIKGTLQTAINAATGAQSTVASVEDITAAQTTLAGALTAFNAAIPHYTGLEAAITTATARYNDYAIVRVGTKFLNQKPANIESLNVAITDANTVLSTATTTEVLDDAIAPLNSAVTTFNTADRMAPSKGRYKIYSYGEAGGHVSANPASLHKQILYSTDSDNLLSYEIEGTLPSSILTEAHAEWIIKEDSTNAYTIQNVATGYYINGSNRILSATAVKVTLPDYRPTGENNAAANGLADNNYNFFDAGYFFYKINNLRLYADSDVHGNADNGRAYAAFQFEEVSTDLTIAADAIETLSPEDYPDGYYGNIIFESDDASTGQLSITGESLKINGVVKLNKTFTPARYYPVGFPFDVAEVRAFGGEVLDFVDGEEGSATIGDFWLRTYENVGGDYKFVLKQEITANTGYAIQFPAAFAGETVTFISENNPVLNGVAAFTGLVEDEYKNAANPATSEITVTDGLDDQYFYIFDTSHPTGTFNRTANAESTLKPFESLIVIKETTSPPVLRTLRIEDSQTGVNDVDAENDKVVDVCYFNLQGMEVAQPVENEVYIVKTIFESGKVEVSKMLYK